MLAEPDRTQFDLRWRMFGVDVRVHPLFWLTAAFLGWGLASASLLYLALWVACVFVSVLLHEMGHVLMGRVFGTRGHIVLHSFGGLAIGSSDLSRRWQRVLVIAAGPGIQLAFWVVLRFLARPLLLALPSDVMYLTLTFLLEINLFWALLNLLPVWPLDGGQISREVCTAAAPRQGASVALGISLVVSGLLAAHALSGALGHPLIPALTPYIPASLFTGIFFAMFAITSYLALQAENQRRARWRDDDDDDEEPWTPPRQAEERWRPRRERDELPWEERGDGGYRPDDKPEPRRPDPRDVPPWER